MVPFETSLRIIPIHGPAEVARVYVRSQSFFKAMELIWSNEMHLSSQRGLIPLPPQIVSIGRNVCAQLRSIVIGLIQSLVGRVHKLDKPVDSLLFSMAIVP